MAGFEGTTAPGDAAYSMVIDAPRIPGTRVERALPIRLSILVPYYHYYEQHWTIVADRIEREPIRDEVTPDLAPALAVAERAIARSYGYGRMDPEVVRTPVPGLFINGENHDPPPTLHDALFTPRRF